MAKLFMKENGKMINQMEKVIPPFYSIGVMTRSDGNRLECEFKNGQPVAKC